MSQRLKYFEGLDRDLGEYPDQNDLPSLTHGHFTKGAEMISLPESDMSSVYDRNYCKRFFKVLGKGGFNTISPNFNNELNV